MSVLAGGLVLALEQGWLRTLWDSFRPRGLHQFPSFHGGGRGGAVVTTHNPVLPPGFCRLFRGSPWRPMVAPGEKEEAPGGIPPASPDRHFSR